jgi:acyl-CoA reductase-like NAD-dependent aldehyde dehydrogenase
VVRDVYEVFLGKFVEKTAALKIGDPHERDTIIGPLINHRQVERLQQVVEASIAQGAKVVYRGPVH